MDWMKVVTNPLGITGFALALVFGVVSRVVVQKRRKNTQWIVPRPTRWLQPAFWADSPSLITVSP
jgi:hypothetical protein